MNSADRHAEARRYFAAGLEAARRLRGIPTPFGTEPSDEADVAFALREIEATTSAARLENYRRMRSAPLEVRMAYKTPGRDTLEKLTGVSFQER